MIKYFDNEEIAMMSFYDKSSLANLITDLQKSLPHAEDKEAADTVANCIDGLCSMTTEEFDELLPKLEAPEMI
ncbi:MAG: transposon-transfer assisting family protein [Angelakisella sp.]